MPNQYKINISDYAVIGFDADDTLWINEPYFRETEEIFCELLKDYMPKDALHSALYATEMQNLALYGYGIKAFILSLIETALKVTKGNLPCNVMHQLIELGKAQLNKPVVLLDGIQEVLESLSRQNTRMVVVTKGDLLDQERKLLRSGLAGYFHHVEVVSDKTETDYRKLLTRLDIKAEAFLMIGNSLRSDVLPVLNIGGSAVYVPYHVTWHHEAEVNLEDHHNYHQLERIDQLLEWL